MKAYIINRCVYIAPTVHYLRTLYNRFTDRCILIVALWFKAILVSFIGCPALLLFILPTVFIHNVQTNSDGDFRWAKLTTTVRSYVAIGMCDKFKLVFIMVRVNCTISISAVISYPIGLCMGYVKCLKHLYNYSM